MNFALTPLLQYDTGFGESVRRRARIILKKRLGSGEPKSQPVWKILAPFSINHLRDVTPDNQLIRQAWLLAPIESSPTRWHSGSRKRRGWRCRAYGAAAGDVIVRIITSGGTRNRTRMMLVPIPVVTIK